LIDAQYLLKFKQVTNEDLLVAGLIESVCDLASVKSILDVGAGTGLVSQAVQKASASAQVTVVDVAPVYQYPAAFHVLRQDWKSVALEKSFDLILFSHVLGDFPVETRMALFQKGIDLLSNGGQIVSIENGSNAVFDAFVKPVFGEQGREFDIDFCALEDVLRNNDLQFARYKFKTYLPLGVDIEEATKSANLFFPQLFASSQQGAIQKLLAGLEIGGRFVLPVTQQMYVASRSLNVAILPAGVEAGTIHE
jgi:SAM-dependent methyltransferase